MSQSVCVCSVCLVYTCSVLQHIMRRRKEMVDVKKDSETEKVPQEDCQLRSIVAEARAVSANEELVKKDSRTPPPVRRRFPDTKPRPKSMINTAPPPPATKSRSSSDSEHPEGGPSTSRSRSLSNSAFDPPPPLMEDGQQGADAKVNYNIVSANP